MSTKRISRAIVESLRPLTGDPSLGTCTVTATSTDVVIPARCFMIPIRSSDSGNEQLDHDNPLRTRADGGDVVVTSAGTQVSIISILGGARQNWAAGTKLRFDPPVFGVNAVATVDALMTGGADASGPGSVRQVLRAETLGGGTIARDLFAARMFGGAPIVMVAWEQSGTSERVGRGAARRPDTWTIYCITSRGNGYHQRADALLDIKDAAEGLLIDRASVAGFVFSAPPATLIGSTRFTATKTSFIYTLKLETTIGVRRNAPDGTGAPDGEMRFADWLRTCLDATTQDQPPFPVVSEFCFTNPQGEFSVEHSTEFT